MRCQKLFARCVVSAVLEICYVATVSASAAAFGYPIFAETPASPANTRVHGVSDDLATLTVKLDKNTCKAGQPVEVSLVLLAGSKGVYLPDYFGDFLKTCIHGFSAAIMTATGRSADPAGVGCGGDGGHSSLATAQTELHNFVYLKPGESRTWHTSLPTKAIPPGKYTVVAEYLSYAYMMEAVASLPQVNGLMAMGRVNAKPIPIQIPEQKHSKCKVEN